MPTKNLLRAFRSGRPRRCCRLYLKRPSLACGHTPLAGKRRSGAIRKSSGSCTLKLLRLCGQNGIRGADGFLNHSHGWHRRTRCSAPGRPLAERLYVSTPWTGGRSWRNRCLRGVRMQFLCVGSNGASQGPRTRYSIHLWAPSSISRTPFNRCRQDVTR